MRLQNKLFLSLIISSALLVVLMLALMQWSVERGMLDYVNIKEEARLAPALEELAQIYQGSDSWSELEQEPHRFANVLRSNLNARHRSPPPPHLRPGPGQAFDRPPPPEGLPRGKPPAAMPQLLDVDNRVVIGAAQGLEGFRLLAIELNGNTVGWLAMPQRKKITDGFELHFLEQQAEAFIVIGLVVIALAMLVAYLLSRHLLKPITSLTRATEQLTQGDFSTRLATGRQDELGLLVRDFNELAESLQRSDASRKRWFADVSHELRTPLAILYAEIEAMLDGIRPLDTKGIVSIQQEVIHLNTLVNDLYILSSADLGSLQYHKQRIDLTALLQEQVRLHRGPMQEAGLQLSLHGPQAACELQADATRLCQLLDNLLANSRKYTDAGGEVRITLSQQSRVATLVIEDSSPGVPQESLGSLFDHLYRVEASRNRSSGGSGLGLAICQRIVEAHGGDIGVAPSSLGGLAVTLHLPQT